MPAPLHSLAPGFALIDRSRTDDRREFTVTVALDCPHCDDHFPGDPIVPAIAQLDLLASLAEIDGIPGDVASIGNLRLRGIVRPGDRLSVQWTGGRFWIFRDDKLLTEATLTWTGGEEA